MNVTVNTIDSAAMGKNVLALRDVWVDQDFPAFEASYVREHSPYYVLASLRVEDLSEIHYLEQNGFHFVETKLQLTAHLTRSKPVGPFENSYEFGPVTTPEELEQVVEIAQSAFKDERMRVDPAVDSELAAKRYEAYVRRSFAQDDEGLFRLKSKKTGEVVAFKSHKYLGDDQVLLLLGGVHPRFENQGVGPINGYFEFNALKARGIRRLTTHVSARNAAIMNMEIGALGFKVAQAFVLLRKLYE